MRCTKCKEVKQASEFYVGVKGIRQPCKECELLANRIRYRDTLKKRASITDK